jgi:hypothetical protein
MDKTVADLNIERFKKLLAIETDPLKRQTIEQLLAEQEARLAVAQLEAEDGRGVSGKS